MSTPSQAPVSRAERVVAFMAVGIAIVAFVCLLTVLSAPLFGVPGESMTAPGWQFAFLVAYFGFPLAFVLIIALIITRVVQNRRAARRG